MERSETSFQMRENGARMVLVCLAFLWLLPLRLSGQPASEKSTKAIINKPDDALFVRRSLPRIQIEIPPEGMAVLREYHWRRNGEDSPREDVRATVREGGQVYTNVAIHLKGSAGSFRPIDSDKPAFTLNFDKFAEGQRFHGLQKIHLNNSVQDSSYVSEQICRELMLKAGVPTPRAGHALVELNGGDSQLYVLVEGWNKQFLKRHFKNTRGNLYDGGAAKDVTYPIEATSGEHPEDRSRLDALVAAAQETNGAARLASLDKVLDVDKFLTFVAMEVMMGHWDGYTMNRNNYRVFHDRESDRMVFMPHGMDQMFGVWRSSPTSTITPMMKGVVAKAVFQSPEIRRRYLDRVAALLTNVFQIEAITNRVQEICSKVQPALIGSIGLLVNQDRAAHWFAERVATRVRSIREQLQEASTPLKFDADGVARPAEWRSSRDAGSPSLSRNRAEPETLQISALGGYAYGSWRAQVLLEKGEYQFVGRIRLQDFQSDDNITRGGATLRLSGDRAPRMLTEAADWTAFNCDFTVEGLSDVELLCELRASQGRAFFDVDSLKVIRKPVK